MENNLPRVVLVGRPNSGKSSLYNLLTGGHAVVGNYPGVTVDLLTATLTLPGGARVEVVDVPGIYALDAAPDAQTDEGVARAFLDKVTRDGRPFLALQVLDGTRLELGLGLTRQLLQRPWQAALVVTQQDVSVAQGLHLDVDALSAALGVPVTHLDARSTAARTRVLQQLETALATQRTKPVESWDPQHLAAAVQTRKGTAQASTTDRLDRYLMQPQLGPVLFLGLMTALFAAVFAVADPATALVDAAVNLARGVLLSTLGAGLFTSFWVDGVLAGAGTVLGFVPQVALLSVGLEAMQASGYLARGAFLVDRMLQALGLSGRAFVPLLMGHACAVPAITATRVIRDPKERLTTILVLPLMTCSARIPTYGILVAAFFDAWGAWGQAAVFVALYFSGVAAALVASFVLRRTVVRGRGLPLVMEMPDYRAPQLRVLVHKAWSGARGFVKDVGTTLVVASALLWVLLNVPAPGAPAHPDGPAVEHSLAASVGRALEPLTAPAGFDWRINVGLLASFGARELMVGTLGIIFGLEDADDNPDPLAQHLRDARRPDGTPAYGMATGLALLAFFVVACQCISTVAAIRRETRSWRWPLFTLVYTYGAGYLLAVLVFQVGRRLGLA